MQTPLNKNQTILAFIILFIFAALVAGASWFYITQYAYPEGDYSSKVVKQKKEEVVEDTEEEVDETADWKTYTNKTYGISFKYPKELTFDDITSDAKKYESNKNYLLILESSSSTDDGYRMAFDIKTITLSAYNELVGLSIPGVVKTKTKIGSYDVYVYTGKGAAEGETTVKEVKTYMFYRDGRAHSLTVAENSPANRIDSIDTAVKTFKFTN